MIPAAAVAVDAANKPYVWLFDPEAPLGVQTDGGWSLGPPPLLEAEMASDAAFRARVHRLQDELAL